MCASSYKRSRCEHQRLKKTLLSKTDSFSSFLGHIKTMDSVAFDPVNVATVAKMNPPAYLKEI